MTIRNEDFNPHYSDYTEHALNLWDGLFLSNMKSNLKKNSKVNSLLKEDGKGFDPELLLALWSGITSGKT